MTHSSSTLERSANTPIYIVASSTTPFTSIQPELPTTCPCQSDIFEEWRLTNILHGDSFSSDTHQGTNHISGKNLISPHVAILCEDLKKYLTIPTASFKLPQLIPIAAICAHSHLYAWITFLNLPCAHYLIPIWYVTDHCYIKLQDTRRRSFWIFCPWRGFRRK